MPRFSCGFVVAFAVALGACGSSSPTDPSSTTFPATPFTTLASQSQSLRVDVRTSPSQPPSRGEQSVELTITDAQTGAPRSGLSLAVVPWMPAMGHGASVVPTVTETTPGTYVVADVDLFMPGTWLLRTNVTGATTDYVEPSFEIP